MDLWVTNLAHKDLYRGPICDDSYLFENLGDGEGFGFIDVRETSGIEIKPLGGAVAEGDELVAFNGKMVDVTKNIWKSLNGLLGKRVKLTFKNKKTEKNVDISLNPIPAGQENRLLLEEWIDSRREVVKQKTSDKVAYIYMRAMGRGDLQRFLKELERDAVPRKEPTHRVVVRSDRDLGHQGEGRIRTAP